MSKAELHENPLVPNKKLRQIYLAMAEARVLDDHILRLQGASKGRRRLDSVRGEEACRVSTAIDLRPGDLIIDFQPGFVMDLLTGQKVSSILERVAAFRSGKKVKKPNTAGVPGRLLPWIDDAGERLTIAMGAALSLRYWDSRMLLLHTYAVAASPKGFGNGCFHWLRGWSCL